MCAADRDQAFLMPPSVADGLPEAHLAWLVLDVVAELELSGSTADHRAYGRGGAVYDPSAMVAVLLYACCTGERSGQAHRAAAGRGLSRSGCWRPTRSLTL